MVGVNHIFLPLHLLSIHILSWYKDDKNWKVKIWKGFKNQRKDYQEGIDHFVLGVRFYNQDSYIPVVNFFTINLPTSASDDVKVWALISSYNAPIARVQRCYFDVYTQSENTLTYIG